MWLDTRSSGSRPNRCSNSSQLCTHFTLHTSASPLHGTGLKSPPLNWLHSHFREARTRPDHLQNTSKADQHFTHGLPSSLNWFGSPLLNRLLSHLREARNWPGTSLVRLKQWYLIHYPKGALVLIKKHHTIHSNILSIISRLWFEMMNVLNWIEFRDTSLLFWWVPTRPLHHLHGIINFLERQNGFISFSSITSP